MSTLHIPGVNRLLRSSTRFEEPRPREFWRPTNSDHDRGETERENACEADGAPDQFPLNGTLCDRECDDEPRRPVEHAMQHRSGEDRCFEL